MDEVKIYGIADYGHGENCPGKCSPDGEFKEWASNREIGREVVSQLRAAGVPMEETWTADHEPLSTPGVMCSKKQLDAALNWRWKKVNEICAKHGAKNCFSISFHSNAAGNSGWRSARGFMAIVGTNASSASKRLAKCIYDEADKRGLRGNRCVPAERYWTQSLAMCNRTACPAVLIEAAFYDNKEDLALLRSAEGRKRIVEAIVAGVLAYVRGA